MIPLASPDIREEDINKVVDVLRSGMLVQGAQVAAFEQSLNLRFVSFAICLQSSTSLKEAECFPW